MMANTSNPEPAPRVLVVDDEIAVLDLMVDVLLDAGYEAVGLNSANEALRKVKTSRFDAMVLDLYMPEMPGMLLHAKVKVVNRTLSERTLFVSGHFDRDELRRELEHSAHFLPKPFTPVDFLASVGRVVRGDPAEDVNGTTEA